MEPLTWNADREIDTHGVVTARIHTKWINFLDDDDVWKPINLTPEDTGKTIRITKAPYELEVPKLSSGGFKFTAKNRYDIWEPDENKRRKNDAPVSVTKTFSSPVEVEATIEEDGTIAYVGAYPHLNADIVIVPHEQEVRYLVRFNSEPTGNQDVSIPFTIESEGMKAQRSLGRGKGKRDSLNSGYEEFVHGFSFDKGSSFRGVSFKKARVWDSGENDKRKSAEIKIIGGYVGGVFNAKKIIPRSFFEGAVFPVYTDTTSTFYPDANAESTSVDGYIGYTVSGISQAKWDEVHDATVGNQNGGDSATTMQTMSGYDGDTWIRRLFALFDTSSIGTDATITAATLNLYITTLDDAQSASAYSYTAVVGTTPASNTALVLDDFDQCGDAINNPTKLSSDKDHGTVSTSAYNTWTLNATGLAAIQKTGVTKLGIRTGWDIEDQYWGTTIGYTYFIAQTADTTGTSQDPYLDVTFVTASATRSPGGGAAYGGAYFY